MWTVEGLILAFLAYASLAVWRRGVTPARRVLVLLACAADAATVWQLANADESRWASVVRAWQPAVQILACYWISGALFVRPMPRLEAWLVRSDAALFSRLRLVEAIARAPRGVLEAFELAYLLVYPVIPAGFAAALIASPDVDPDRYWSMVVGAELACYAAQPWLQSRPPRALGDRPRVDARQLALRRVNLSILQRGSIQVNTLPSAHAAGAVATAFAVAAVSPAAGAVFAFIAAGIVVGSIVGRYHYAIDSLLGVLVALATVALL